MVESGGAAGPGSGHRSKPASSLESAAGRIRFAVELRPDETTIVSWRKLLKEHASNKSNGPGLSVPGPSIEAHLEPVPLPPLPPAPAVAATLKQPVEGGPDDSEAPPGPNRLSNVIERIERMYAGNGSSDEEDVVLDDIPDDDEYDTEDSFIDDTELDDYFQVDNSAIKHDGFFVNRGQLERIEPTIAANQQPKKRRRKDMTKGQGGSDDGQNPNKHMKIGSKGRKPSPLTERKSSSQSHKVAVPDLHNEELRLQVSPENASEALPKKKTADTKITMNPSNGDIVKQEKNTDQLRTGGLSSKNNNKKKERSELQDTSSRRSNVKVSYSSKSHSVKQQSNANELDQSLRRKEKSERVERFDLNIPASRESLPNAPVVQRKDASSVRPKGSMLEKAFRELEKIVAESRPPSAEVQDPDNSSQAIKRRLSPEIKQKLAKVARFAQASYGKIPKEVINRLMSIVGHLMQLRTLKRNLKVLASSDLSAKQEKDDRVDKTKQEVAEMVNLQIPYMKSKVEQHTANTDDVQEAGPEVKEAFNLRCSMDDALENKICELYDLYAERLEEHSGPPIRRLYEELAALWPCGFVDTDGIKRAIYRAKERRNALVNYRKDQQKIKKRKVTPKLENTSRGETISFNQAPQNQEKSIFDSRGHDSFLTSKPVPSAAASYADVHLPIAAFLSGQNMDKLKPQKSKGSSSSNPIEAVPISILPKKKVKKKPSAEANAAQFRFERVPVSQAEERIKNQNKLIAIALPAKANTLPSGASESHS